MPSPPNGARRTTADFAAELRRMQRVLQGREPEGLRDRDLSVTVDRPMWLGTTVPMLGSSFSATESGLVVPTATRRPAPIDTMRTYITAEMLLDTEISLGAVAFLLERSSLRDALIACSWLMAQVHNTGAGRDDAQVHLVETLLAGRVRDRALAMVRDRWVFMAPQVILGAIKLCFLLDHPENTDPSVDSVHDAVFATLGLAQYIGSAHTDDDRNWGTLPERLSLDIVANQHFNATPNTGSILARYQLMWRELPVERDPAVAALHDEGFEAATGTTMEICHNVGMGLATPAIATGNPHLSADYLDSFSLNQAELAAVRLLVADESRLRGLVEREVGRMGFNWAANTFRRYPIIRHEDGSMTIVSPRFLVDRISDWVFYWELNNHFNSDDRSWGGFKDFRGRISEDYVGRSLAAMYPEWEGSSKRIWTEQELHALWPNQSLCDFVIDGGDEWICIEVVSHMLSAEVVTAQSAGALDRDIEYIAEEKAEQLHATSLALLADDAPVLLGRERVPSRVLPVIVAAGGFPVNPITMTVVHERLRTLGFLQHAQIGQVEILDLDDLESIELLMETGGPTLSRLLRDKATAGLRLAGMDSYIVFERHLTLGRPTRLKAALDSAHAPFLRWAQERLGFTSAQLEIDDVTDS